MKNLNFKSETDGYLNDLSLIQDNSSDIVEVGYGNMRYSGTVRSCDLTLGCIFKWCARGAAIFGLIDLFTKKSVDDSKHTNKMDEIKYAHDCKMEAMREANKLAKDKMDYAEKIRQERHAKVDDAQVEVPTSGFSDKIDESSFYKAKTLNDIIAENSKTEFKPLVSNLITGGGIFILYGPTGLGKTILSNQIGIDAAEGKASSLVPNSVKCTPQSVKYLDSELDDDDISSRYGKYGYYFPENLERFEVTFESPEKFTDFIKRVVVQEDSDCLIIIDNILTICPALNGEKSKHFIRNLKGIQQDARTRGITITFIIVGHTTKTFTGGPIQLKDLSGSFNMSAMATGVYGITSKSSDGKFIQLEVLKSRRNCDVGTKYILEKQEKPYVHFRYSGVVSDSVNSSVSSSDCTQAGQSNENSTIGSPANNQQNDVIQMIQMHQNGSSLREIADKYGTYPMDVCRKIKAFKDSH